MIRIFLLMLALPIVACQAQTTSSTNSNTNSTSVEEYAAQFPDDGKPSQAVGTAGNGSLKNGKLLPFSGPNFEYFDALSYCSGRAFAHSSVKATILGAYKRMETTVPGRHFGLMECAHQHGGKLSPHRTHQNGMSVDFMMPLLKDGVPY